jgi:hypothetical protein
MAVEDALDFYDRHYQGLGQWFLSPGKIQFLGSKTSKICRFCGKRSPEVTFALEAHAIPEMLGNKSLFTRYECDQCNQLFGKGIENDFGNWSKPMRTMARIRGKKGVPTITKGSSGGWRIEYGPTGFEIKQYEDDPFYSIDEAAKTITFNLNRDPYTPVAVLKALVKMGLSILPDSEMVNFRVALDWIRRADHTFGLVGSFPIFYSFVPGPMPNDAIALMTFRRRSEEGSVPYSFFVLGYGNEIFQVFLPTPERDQVINGKPLSLPPFPNPRDLTASEFGPVMRGPLDLTGRTQIKGDVAIVRTGFATDPPNSSGSGC